MKLKTNISQISRQSYFFDTCSKLLWYDSQCSSLQNAENFKQYNDLLSLFGFFLWHFVISEQYLPPVVELGLVVFLPFHIQLKILQVPLGGVFVARLTNEMVRNSSQSMCRSISKDCRTVPLWCYCPERASGCPPGRHSNITVNRLPLFTAASIFYAWFQQLFCSWLFCIQTGLKQ